MTEESLLIGTYIAPETNNTENDNFEKDDLDEWFVLKIFHL